MGYSAPQNPTTVLTLGVALATDDLDNGAVAFDNTTNRDAWAMAELYLGASAVDLSSDDANPVCYLYLIPSYDGTNYGTDGDETNELVPSEYLKGVFEFNKETGQQYAVIDKFDIGPVKYMAVLFNSFGVTSVPSGATVKISSFDRA